MTDLAPEFIEWLRQPPHVQPLASIPWPPPGLMPSREPTFDEMNMLRASLGYPPLGAKTGGFIIPVNADTPDEEIQAMAAECERRGISFETFPDMRPRARQHPSMPPPPRAARSPRLKVRPKIDPEFAAWMREEAGVG